MRRERRLMRFSTGRVRRRIDPLHLIVNDFMLSFQKVPNIRRRNVPGLLQQPDAFKPLKRDVSSSLGIARNHLLDLRRSKIFCSLDRGAVLHETRQG
jgi:hypothetical protein